MCSIANFFTSVRNASAAKKQKVKIPSSKIKKSITAIFQREGYIESFKIEKENNFEIIIIFLKPNTKGFKQIVIFSKPGGRVYVKWSDIPRIYNNLATVILSTSQGIMTGKEAREREIGGELLGYIH